MPRLHQQILDQNLKDAQKLQVKAYQPLRSMTVLMKKIVYALHVEKCMVKMRVGGFAVMHVIHGII